VRVEAAKALIEGGDARLAELRVELTAVKQSLEANAYDDELLAALTGAANLAVAIERSTKAWKDGEVRLGALERAAKAGKISTAETSANWETAREALIEAETVLEEARRHDLAAALQAGLKAGDACPVCGRAIGELTIAPAGDLETARQAFDAARRCEESSRAAAGEAATKAAVAENDLINARQQATQLQAQLAEAAKELENALPSGHDRTLIAIQATLETQKAAREERSRLQKREAELAQALLEGEHDLKGAQAAVAEAAAETRAATAAVEQAQGRVEAADKQLAELVAGEGWTDVSDRDPVRSFEKKLDDATAGREELLKRRGALEERLRHLAQDIETAKGLRQEVAGKKAAHNIAADLALMLRADRFQAYVQAEALRALAEDGSRRLLELSAGRYELEVAAGGQDFMVRDKWNADDVRSVRTLSGGETFLASLALALALAESLPGLAPSRRLSLDSIFLDEGFGSLDPEALDRAADALDALRIENRLVCVITHLKELAERMPAHIVVNKAETGSSITVL
jgi:exonuclease SbcC